ncbi:MAG: hypothetical protein AAGA81_14520 [Acidobacteriota bacterium]
MRIPAKSTPSIPCAALAPILLAATLIACGGATEEAAPEATGPAVELPAINLAFDGLPAGFVVGSSGDDTVELVPSDPEGNGRMWIEAGELSDFGIDLVQVVTDQTEAYAQLDNSEYYGGRKLVVAAAGEAYYVRGRYDENGERVEETRIFLVHPSENRLVSLHYAYPAGEDSGDRVQELFAFAGELGVLDLTGGAAAASEDA